MHEEISVNEVAVLGPSETVMDWNVIPAMDPRHTRKYYEFLRRQVRDRIIENEKPPAKTEG